MLNKPAWSQIHRELLASASQVLRLKTCETMPRQQLWFWYCLWDVLYMIGSLSRGYQQEEMMCDNIRSLAFSIRGKVAEAPRRELLSWWRYLLVLEVAQRETFRISHRREDASYSVLVGATSAGIQTSFPNFQIKCSNQSGISFSHLVFSH